MELSERILEILEKSGLTPSEFADKIEVQRSAISHITSGRNKPSLEFLIKIKNVFPEIDTEWLFLGTEKKLEEPLNSNIQPSPAPTLFDLEETATEVKNEMPRETINDEKETQDSLQIPRQIKKIVFFYDDGTFEDFSQNRV